jgi:hypothetical protein
MPAASGSGRLVGAPSRYHEESQRVVRAEFMKPLVLLAVGVTVTTVTISGPAAKVAGPVGAVVVLFYLVQLGIGVVITSAIFWLAAKTWLGDIGTIPLIIARVAGISAVTQAIVVLSGLVVAVSPAFGCFGLLAALGAWVGLTAWLFDLSLLQIVVLIIFAVIVEILLGLGLGAILAALG